MDYIKGVKCTAIVLAAGVGKRMKSDVPKQFMLLEGKPLLYYSLQTFQESFIQDIIVVTGKEEIEYCRHEIVEKYHFSKVRKIVAGGKERYHSVYQGLNAIEECDYVYIHDGARPFVEQRMLTDGLEVVDTMGACVIAVKAKDTIKLSDDKGIVKETPDRDYVWQVQTPQIFRYDEIKKAHELVMERDDIHITDDAFVYECAFHKPIQLVMGSYENIKITTPEDMDIAQVFLRRKKRNEALKPFDIKKK